MTTILDDTKHAVAVSMPPDLDTHRAELEEAGPGAAVRYACEQLGTPTTGQVRIWLETYGVTVSKTTLYDTVSRWRLEHSVSDTGSMRQLTTEVLAELDAAAAEPDASGSTAGIPDASDQAPEPRPDASGLAARVAAAEARLEHQDNPALIEALSEPELDAERDLAERIRQSRREQRWKDAVADAEEQERDRRTAAAIRRQDSKDVLLARKALADQRRQSSPHAKLARLYRLRSWSLRALATVVGAGMVWSAVNVQHNIAPGGMGDPLYWFSYLIEAMISLTLIVIMVGSNEVAEWGIVDNKWMVAGADLGLLALTLGLNTYPYLKAGNHFGAAAHAVAPVMIGIALVVHHAASTRYGKAIGVATERVAAADAEPSARPWRTASQR